jgi:hypothetical protein
LASTRRIHGPEPTAAITMGVDDFAGVAVLVRTDDDNDGTGSLLLGVAQVPGTAFVPVALPQAAPFYASEGVLFRMSFASLDEPADADGAVLVRGSLSRNGVPDGTSVEFSIARDVPLFGISATTGGKHSEHVVARIDVCR